MGASLYLGQVDTSSEESSGGSSVGFMITLALFFHKAPESAGYGTFIVGMNCPLGTRLAYLAVSESKSIFNCHLTLICFLISGLLPS